MKISPHCAPYVRAEWLKKTVWTDLGRFLENPGEVLERVREQKGSEDHTEDIEARGADLEKRLAAKQVEKDRFIRLDAQGRIPEEELDVYLVDLKNQTENLRLPADAVEADLSQKREGERSPRRRTHGSSPCASASRRSRRIPRRLIGRAAGW